MPYSYSLFFLGLFDKQPISLGIFAANKIPSFQGVSSAINALLTLVLPSMRLTLPCPPLLHA